MPTKQPVPPPKRYRGYVRIKDGVEGKLGVAWCWFSDGKIETKTINGKPVVQVNLLRSCFFVSPEHLEEVKPTSPPPPRKK